MLWYPTVQFHCIWFLLQNSAPIFLRRVSKQPHNRTRSLGAVLWLRSNFELSILLLSIMDKLRLAKEPVAAVQNEETIPPSSIQLLVHAPLQTSRMISEACPWAHIAQFACEGPLELSQIPSAFLLRCKKIAMVCSLMCMTVQLDKKEEKKKVVRLLKDHPKGLVVTRRLNNL